MDSMTPEQRHRCMARIRSKDTTPEWRVRRAVHAMGFRYRLHVKKLPGCPDLVLPRHRKVIFVHGCFWHAHDCAVGRRKPATREAFWRTKFERNMARDNKVLRQLWELGWQTLVIWECQTKNDDQLRATVTAFLAATPLPENYELKSQHALYGLAAEPPTPYGEPPDMG